MMAGAGAPNTEGDDVCGAPNADVPNADMGAAGVDVDAVPPPPNADIGCAPPDGGPKTDPPGACAAAASPKADGCPPAKAEKAPPPPLPLPLVVPAAAGVVLAPDAAGFANAEKPPVVGAAGVDPKADGLPNDDWPNEDCPNADVVCGAPKADLGAPNADEVAP